MRDSPLFVDLAGSILQNGHYLRFTAEGWSMRPTIQHGDTLPVEQVDTEDIRRGDILLYRSGGGVRAHRVQSIPVAQAIVPAASTLLPTHSGSRNISPKSRIASLRENIGPEGHQNLAQSVSLGKESELEEPRNGSGGFSRLMDRAFIGHRLRLNWRPMGAIWAEAPQSPALGLSMRRRLCLRIAPSSRHQTEHRPLHHDGAPSLFFTVRGDAAREDELVAPEEILGRGVFVERHGRRIRLRGPVVEARRALRRCASWIKKLMMNG